MLYPARSPFFGQYLVASGTDRPLTLLRRKYNIQNYCTYLHVAARYGLTDVVAGMLEADININEKDKVRSSPL
jgi:hypothetical protein